MSRHPASDLQVTLAAAARRLSANNPFAILFARDDEVTVELYAPVGADGQQPHDRDELYIVATGSGRFRRDEDVVAFGPGDLLYVPAHVPHRFESFSEDFKVWVIFFGPPRPVP
jgi:mannose-6-phosphate isomerase-like protein (cupin superfamily)